MYYFKRKQQKSNLEYLLFLLWTKEIEMLEFQKLEQNRLEKLVEFHVRSDIELLLILWDAFQEKGVIKGSFPLSFLRSYRASQDFVFFMFYFLVIS